MSFDEIGLKVIFSAKGEWAVNIVGIEEDVPIGPEGVFTGVHTSGLALSEDMVETPPTVKLDDVGPKAGIDGVFFFIISVDRKSEIKWFHMISPFVLIYRFIITKYKIKSTKFFILKKST